jgi:hypothetical protein
MKTAESTLAGNSIAGSIADKTSAVLRDFVASRPDRLQEHILATYVLLRWGIIFVAIALPFALWALGVIGGQPLKLQPSLSDYYYAGEPVNRLTRDVFVGVLFLVGGFLFLYKGYSKLEDWLLNIAGLCACGAISDAVGREGDFGSPLSRDLRRDLLCLHCARGHFLCDGFSQGHRERDRSSRAATPHVPRDRCTDDPCAIDRSFSGARAGLPRVLDDCRGSDRHLDVLGLLDHEEHRAWRYASRAYAAGLGAPQAASGY